LDKGRYAMRSGTFFVLGVATLGLAACGGGGGGGGSCTPGQTAALTISATGISPTNVCVAPSGTVTFTNNDAVVHVIEFDTPTVCPTVGNVPANGGQVPVVFPTAENCSFHDAGSSSNSAFKGTVAVTAVTVSGGY
jgi:plastocyanin